MEGYIGFIVGEREVFGGGDSEKDSQHGDDQQGSVDGFQGVLPDNV